MEEIFLQIISNVGTARSCYIEAIHCAKDNHFEDAEKKLEEGKKFFIEGHKFHSELIAKEAAGEHIETGMFLMHAEDQLMSAEAFSILAEEFISVYKAIRK